MPSPNPAVPVEQLLDAARNRVAETGLREAAAEMHLDFSTLGKLLKRADGLRTSTATKLTTWYLTRAAAGELDVTPEVAQAAFGVLVRHLPESARESAIGELAQMLRQRTLNERGRVPPWLADD